MQIRTRRLLTSSRIRIYTVFDYVIDFEPNTYLQKMMYPNSEIEETISEI